MCRSASISDGDGVVPSALDAGGVRVEPVARFSAGCRSVPLAGGGWLMLPVSLGVGLVIGYDGVLLVPEVWASATPARTTAAVSSGRCACMVWRLPFFS